MLNFVYIYTMQKRNSHQLIKKSSYNYLNTTSILISYPKYINQTKYCYFTINWNFHKNLMLKILLLQWIMNVYIILLFIRTNQYMLHYKWISTCKTSSHISCNPRPILYQQIYNIPSLISTGFLQYDVYCRLIYFHHHVCM